VEQGPRDLTVGVGGRAVRAGDLAPGVGRREGLQVGVGEPDGRRIWPRRHLRCEDRRKSEAGAVREGAGARGGEGACLPGRIQRAWGHRGRSTHRRTSSSPTTAGATAERERFLAAGREWVWYLWLSKPTA
jgi:hypothetical protein